MPSPDDIVVEIHNPYPPDPSNPRGFKMQCFNPEELFCLCGGIDDDTPMIECSNCADWFHCRCIGITPRKAEQIGFYACPFCVRLLAADVPEGQRFTKQEIMQQQSMNRSESEQESDNVDIEESLRTRVCSECKNNIKISDPVVFYDQRSYTFVSFCSPKCRRIYRRNALENRPNTPVELPVVSKRPKRVERPAKKEKTESTDDLNSVEVQHEPVPVETVESNADKYTEIIRRNVRIGFECIFKSFNLDFSPDLPERLEASLWNLYSDHATQQTGNLYKSKYRSLSYNLKDPKNKELRRKLVEQSISTDSFVSMSADELANQEMSQEIRRMQECNLRNTVLTTHYLHESLDIQELEQLMAFDSENDQLVEMQSHHLTQGDLPNAKEVESSLTLHPDEKEIVQEFASQYLNCSGEEASPIKGETIYASNSPKDLSSKSLNQGKELDAQSDPLSDEITAPIEQTLMKYCSTTQDQTVYRPLIQDPKSNSQNYFNANSLSSFVSVTMSNQNDSPVINSSSPPKSRYFSNDEEFIESQNDSSHLDTALPIEQDNSAWPGEGWEEPPHVEHRSSATRLKQAKPRSHQILSSVDPFFNSIRRLNPSKQLDSLFPSLPYPMWRGSIELPSVDRMPFNASFIGSNCSLSIDGIMGRLFVTPQALVIEGILPVDHGLKYIESVLKCKPVVCFLLEGDVEDREEGEFACSFESIYNSLSNDFKIGVVGHIPTYAKDAYLVPWSSSIRYPSFDGTIKYLNRVNRCSDLNFFLMFITLRGQFLACKSTNNTK